LLTRIRSQADFLFRSQAAAIFTGAAGILVLLFFLPNLINFTSPADVTELTNTGTVAISSTTSASSAVSSDGKYFVHVEEENGMQRLLLTLIETNTAFEVVPLAKVQYLGLSFSRDNNHVYFTQRKGTDDKLYRVPVMSKSPVLVKDGVDGAITISPTGDKFAFVRLDTTKSEYSLRISDIDGSNERPIGATRVNGETLSVSGAAWSPDGNTLVCGVGAWSDGFHMKLVSFDVQTGTEQTFGENWFSILQVAWQDMSGLVISARQRETSPFQLWRVTYPSGEAEKITKDLAEYRGVSLAGNKIVTVKTTTNWSIWVTTLGNPPSRSITPGTGLTYGITWMPNGKIVYTAMAQDRLNLFRVDADGNNRIQLTSNAGDNYNPATSPDGRFLVFSSNRGGTGRFNIWRINAEDGSDAQQLTFMDGNFYPTVSWDNQWVTYDNQTNVKLNIWKVPLQGGESTRLVDAEGYRMPVFSRDNQFIAGRHDSESGTTDVAVFPASGGPPVKHITLPIIDWQRVHWMDDHTLSFVNNAGGASNIWSYDLNTDTSKQLTNFEGEQIFAYAWSSDFKQVISQRGRRVSNVTMLTQDAH
jgi:Tol biopolymer transport system component